MILTCAIASLAFVTSAPGKAIVEPTYFVFLVKGANPPKATPEEIGQYQATHISNFKTLFDAGKLVTAGPVSDPTGFRRGIIVMSVKNRYEIAPCFEADPYVKKGFMEIQSLRMDVLFGKLNTAGIEPTKIEENRIVIFTAGALPADSTSVRANRLKHLEHNQKGGGKAGLAFYANLGDSDEIRSIAFFRGKNDKEILAWLKKDPLVKSGMLKPTKMPQYLVKGVLDAAKTDKL